MTEENALPSKSIIHQDADRYRLVEEGDRWRCIQCGSCCHTDFEEHWLDFIFTNQHPRTITSKCSYLKFENNRHSCAIYSKRSNACKAFPFTLRKQKNGRYRLIIHAQCRGFGKGKVINIRQRIFQCLRLFNKEFHKRMRFDFTTFDKYKDVVLVK